MPKRAFDDESEEVTEEEPEGGWIAYVDSNGEQQRVSVSEYQQLEKDGKL